MATEQEIRVRTISTEKRAVTDRESELLFNGQSSGAVDRAGAVCYQVTGLTWLTGLM